MTNNTAPTYVDPAIFGPTNQNNNFSGYFDTTPVYVTLHEMNELRQDILILKLQNLKLAKLIEDKQYKSILSMLASPDERDKEMARLSIRTLYDEHL